MIEPGLYDDLSNEAYHGDRDYLSSSVLKQALPERYKTGGSQEALDFGTLFHTVVLEPENLDAYTVLDAHAIAGTNAKGERYAAPQMTAKFKAAVAEAVEAGRIVVTQDDWDKAHAMRDAVAAHPAAAPLIYGEGATEESAFWIDDSDVRHKARFDKRIPGAIIDLKSTSAKPGGDSLARAVIDCGYDLSAVHYNAVARGLDLDVDAFAFVFVGKEPPHRVTVAELDDAFWTRGRVLRALAIERHLNPAAPAYEGADGYLTLSAPRWARIDDMEIPA